MNNYMNTENALYPIREVSRLTGVNAITLRAWERRYDLFEPVRTESGHRLFTQANIDRINAAVKLTEQGIPISQVKRFLEEQTDSVSQVQELDDYDYSTALVLATLSMDLERLHAELDQAFSDLDDQTVNLVLRKVTLKISAEHVDGLSFWESVLLPRLHVRLRNMTRGLSLSYTKRIWLQSTDRSHSDLFGLLAALHVAGQGWYPLLQSRGIYEPKALFQSIQKFKCQALLVVDDTGDMSVSFWNEWVKSYPSLDFYYYVNQDEVSELSNQLSAHYQPLGQSFN